MEGALQLAPSRPAVRVPCVRILDFGEALRSAVEFKHQVLRCRVARFQVPKRNGYGVIVGVFIGDQDKGIIGPKFQFRRFAE